MSRSSAALAPPRTRRPFLNVSPCHLYIHSEPQKHKDAPSSACCISGLSCDERLVDVVARRRRLLATIPLAKTGPRSVIKRVSRMEPGEWYLPVVVPVPLDLRQAYWPDRRSNNSHHCTESFPLLAIYFQLFQATRGSSIVLMYVPKAQLMAPCRKPNHYPRAI